ncbi:MAG: hypothetical protein ACRDA6_09270, partial [Aeromonas veronii]
ERGQIGQIAIEGKRALYNCHYLLHATISIDGRSSIATMRHSEKKAGSHATRPTGKFQTPLHNPHHYINSR